MMSPFATYPSLADAPVLISGGGSGIGASLVEHFALQGARVGFVDIADEPSRALVAALSGRARHRPEFRRADVTDIAGYQAAIAELAGTCGPFRVLVNNAASDDRHDFRNVDQAYWDNRMAVNLRHYFFAGQAVFEGMKAAGGGAIVNYSSTSWVMGEGGYVCYTTAKAAIVGLTRSFARDFGPHNIRANAILPGWVMTERQLRLWVDAAAEARIFEQQALKQKLYPADVARMTLFLAADDSRMITGQSFIVDGGWN
jgi:NAD(P)-dependent dehydrogenase (short-subunit alcohol dehydrogenase family)